MEKRFLKHLWLPALCLFFFVSRPAAAQPGLTGRIYDNPNIMAQMLDQAQIEQRLDSVRTDAVEKFISENGRRPDAAEMQKIDLQIDEARQQLELMRKAMETGITVEFTSDAEYVVNIRMRMDEEALKAAGIPWVKRKAMKAAISMMSDKKEKVKYFRKDDMIITKDAEPDTLYLSGDGKQLVGRHGKSNFTLTQIR